MTNKKELFIINGFLGSGKTTFVNELYKIWADKKIAIIVNEYGQTGLDGQVLERDEIELVEISNGSIFCSCRSDLFIEAMRQISKLDLEIVIIESSGLSNPEGMGKIIELIQKLTENVFVYRGSITMVDAVEFIDVYETSVIAKQQVIHSDLLIINKIDLVNSEELDNIRKILKELNPFAKIIEATFAKIDRSELENLKSDITIKELNWTGRGVLGAQKLVVSLEGNFTREEILEWVEGVAPNFYRMKGFVQVDGIWKYINATTNIINLEDTELIPVEKVVAVIGPGDKPLIKEMKAKWDQIFDDDKELIFV